MEEDQACHLRRAHERVNAQESEVLHRDQELHEQQRRMREDREAGQR